MARTNENVLISGAGIAGPALAFWLEQYGFSPTVIEQAPTPREGGYAFHLHGARGIEVLQRMGVWPRVLEARREDREARFVDRSNRIIARINTPSSAAEVEPSKIQVTIRRADLARVLFEHTKDRVEYIFGETIRAVRQDEQGVEVGFDSGGTRRFDLVVGADGLHSVVRKLAFGEEHQFRRDLGHCVAAFTLSGYPVGYGVDIVYTVPGKVVTLWGLKDNSTLVIFMFRQPDEIRALAHDMDRQKQLLVDTFACEGWELPRLLEAMQTAGDFFFDAVTQIRMARWSDGRVALVGDAAYCPSPLSGFGSQLALVGAYTLAGELKVAAGDHHAAFRAYERELRPFVEQKQKNPERAVRQFVPGSASGLWIRNQALKLLSIPWLSQVVLKMTYGRLLHESFTLKDYEAV